MRTILNVIWLMFGGIWLAALYFLAGIIACVFIITIPFGIASFRMARYVLWPFGKAVVQRPDAGVVSGIGNVTSSASLVRPEIIVRPDFARAADLGVTAASIGETVRVATAGDYEAWTPGS